MPGDLVQFIILLIIMVMVIVQYVRTVLGTYRYLRHSRRVGHGPPDCSVEIKMNKKSMKAVCMSVIIGGCVFLRALCRVKAASQPAFPSTFEQQFGSAVHTKGSGGSSSPSG
jgi:hypothetical protein